MKTHLPLWSSVLIVISLSAGASLAIAVPNQPQFSTAVGEIPISQANFPPQDLGSPHSTIGAGTRLYLPPPDDSHPRSTAGAGKRGTCLKRDVRPLFLSIMFAEQADTIATRPSLWWYIPPNDGAKLEFSLFKQTGNEDALVYYQVINEVNLKSGLLQVHLPETILEAGHSYWWDLTLVCDAFDRSGDTYLWGSLQRLDPQSLLLRKDPEVLQALATQLLQEPVYFSMEPTLARQLGTALQHSSRANIEFVEARLRDHYLMLQEQYETLNYSIVTLELQSSITNSPRLTQLKERRRNLILELVQLSADFGVWGDTTNLLATYRQEYPEEWSLLLTRILPKTLEETEVTQSELIQLLQTISDFSEH